MNFTGMVEMICWCYWGWPKAIRDIYDRAKEAIDAFVPCQENDWTDGIGGESALQYGPAHVVWADENFCRRTVQGCLEDALAGRHWHTDPEETAMEKSVVIRSLEELLALPDSILDAVPSGYDGVNPESFPPVVEMEKAPRRS